MTRMLVVASPTLAPLSTDVPLDLTGQSEQADCHLHGRVVLDYGNDGHIADDGPDTGTEVRHRCIYGDAVYCADAGCGPEPVQLDPRYPCGPLVPDGPFPFTVAVWQECVTCEGYGCVDTGGEPPYDSLPCPSWCEGCGGAVVATVEVTGPSHHADECVHETSTDVTRWSQWGYCHRDARGSWHTPTGQVHRLDHPIPMERPVEVRDVLEGPGLPPAVGDDVEVPAPWWWADLDLEVPA